MTRVNRTLIRVIAEVGPILGFDGRDYDLREGDVVALPTVNAGALLAKGGAELLDDLGAIDGTTDMASTTDDLLEEAEAVAGGLDEEFQLRARREDTEWQFADWVWAQQRAKEEAEQLADPDDLLMAGMGDPDAMTSVGTADLDDDRRPKAGGSNAKTDQARPTSALPTGQLEALDHHDRKRAAQKRGLDWPSTREARDRLFAKITEVMRNQDTAVVDAPTSLGKSHIVATTAWGSDTSLAYLPFRITQ